MTSKSLFAGREGRETSVHCSTTLNCSSTYEVMSVRECCVDSEEGLSYSVKGQQKCYKCIGMLVFICDYILNNSYHAP